MVELINTLKCIIVDDDPIAVKIIEQCVKKTPFLKLTGTCGSNAEAEKLLKNENIDLVLLDVEMPEGSGMDLIKGYKNIPQIILISSKKDYAAEAFDYNVTDYIVKPVEYPRFLKAVKKAREMNESFKPKLDKSGDIFIKHDGALVKLNIKDINYVEALADYAMLYTDNGRYTILSTMKAIETRLPVKSFIRIHRSYIVQIDKITTVEGNNVYLGDKKLPVSRANKNDILSRIRTVSNRL